MNNTDSLELASLLCSRLCHDLLSPVGALTLLTINELIRAAGVNSNYQAIVSGLLLYIFIVLQSVVVWLRGRGQFRLALPSWLVPVKKSS